MFISEKKLLIIYHAKNRRPIYCWVSLLSNVLSLLSTTLVDHVWYMGRLFGIFMESNTVIKKSNIVIWEINTIFEVVSKVIHPVFEAT